MRICIFFLFVCFSLNQSQAQILKRLGDRTMSKIQRKAEDKIVEELSEKIANRAVRPINSLIDSMFKESYESETGESYDPENSEKMNAFFNSYFGNVDIPASYSFDYISHIEIKDFGEKKSVKMKMYIAQGGDIFGIEQHQDSDPMMVVFDNKNEAFVSYNLKQKTCLAMNINSQMMATFGQMSRQYADDEDLKMTITKTGKTKKILDYSAEEIEVSNNETKSKAYISNDVPFDWNQSFGTMMKQFAPYFYQENESYKMDGMLLEAITTRLDDNKKSEWKTKKIESKSFQINNNEFEKQQIGDYNK